VNPTYSSTAAFLAHYSVLSANAASLGPDDTAQLEAMRKAFESLEPWERETLISDDSAVPARRRERAERDLRRTLIELRMLSS